MLSTTFTHLNEKWNAEPNAPEPKILVQDDILDLEFYANAFAYENFQ